MTTPTNEELFQGGLQPSALMSPMEAAALLDAAAKGDTTNAVPASVDTGASLDAGTVEGTQAAPAVATPAATPAAPAAPANPVVMAKDNVHTIPWGTFENERNGRQTAEQALTAANAKIAELTAQSTAAAAAGQTTTQVDAQLEQVQAALDKGIDPKLFGDWSPEAMAEGIQKAIELGTAKFREDLMAQVSGVKATTDAFAKAQEQTAVQGHYATIYKAHPDADSIYESKELQDWIGGKPAFMQPALKEVFTKGSTQDIVDFLATFKAETGLKPAPRTPAVDARTAANAAIAAAKDNTIPASVSHISGASPGPGSVFEAMDAMSGPALAEALEGMSKTQREAYLNRTG